MGTCPGAVVRAASVRGAIVRGRISVILLAHIVHVA